MSGELISPSVSVFGKTARRVLITAGAVLCALTAANMAVGNSNLGTYLPAAAGLPLLLAGIFFYPLYTWEATPAGHITLILFVIFYGAAAAVLTVSSAAILSAAIRPVPQKADAVVVLGAAVHGDEVTDTLEKRLAAAAEYYRANPDTVLVVTGGMGSGENLSEAAAMHKYLTEHGLPEEAVIMEDKATSTEENFRFSKALLDDRFGGEDYRIVYVTSDFHVPRAGLEASRAGFKNASGLGAPTPVLTAPGAWMRESAALLYSLVRG